MNKKFVGVKRLCGKRGQAWKCRKNDGTLKKGIAVLLAAVVWLGSVLSVSAAERQSALIWQTIETSQAGQSAEAAETAETGQSAEASAAVTVAAPSALLMEASTGQVIFEKDADTRRSPASVTKVMTMLLTFEALEKGKIKLKDEVMTSAHAKSMGGSQVFLEEGEIQSVETLIKCVVIASGNDASVALAEHIAGSEEAFVALMNERAAALGMENTHFEDCCGLTASDNHYTTARDIAVMSRELITKYPQIFV